MTTIKDAINKCDTMVDFNNLLKDIQPKIGKMGGRRFVEGASGHRGLTGDVAIKDIAKKFYKLIKDPSTTEHTMNQAKTFIAKLNNQANIDVSGKKGFKGVVIKLLTVLRRLFGGKFDRKEFDMKSLTKTQKAIITACDSTDLRTEMKHLKKDDIKILKSNMPKSYEILLKLANEGNKNKQDKLKLEFTYEFGVENEKLTLGSKEDKLDAAMNVLVAELTFIKQIATAFGKKEDLLNEEVPLEDLLKEDVPLEDLLQEDVPLKEKGPLEVIQGEDVPLEEIIESLTDTQKAALIAYDSKDLKEDMEKLNKNEIINIQSLIPNSYDILLELANEDNKNNQDILKVQFYYEIRKELDSHSEDFKKIYKENFDFLQNTMLKIRFIAKINQAF